MVSQFLDLCPFPKIIGIIFPLITLGNYPADKNEPHHISELSCLLRPTLVAQLVKKPPAVQKIPVLFLGQEDLLEKG